jgi:hypothetical protein
VAQATDGTSGRRDAGGSQPACLTGIFLKVAAATPGESASTALTTLLE